jgi:Flp pilus assembly protein TadG
MKLLGKIGNTRKLNSKGQAIVEVSFIFLLMVILVGSAVDWGLGLFASHMVQNAVRQAAREAVTQNTVTVANVKAAVSAALPDTGLFSGFKNASNTTVSCAMSGGSPIISVTTNGTFNFIFLRMVGLTNFPITHSAQMRYERDPTACPI